MPSLHDVGIRARSHDGVLRDLRRGGWRQIGEGGHAVVHGHEDWPDLVVREGNAADGYATYAMLSRGPLRPFVGEHVPIVHDLRLNRDGSMVALAERLDEIDLEEAPRVVRAARTVLSGAHAEDLWPGDLAELRDAFPSLPAFIAAYREATGRGHFDLRDGNLMRRGRMLIVNDPIGQALFGHQIADIRARLPLDPWTADEVARFADLRAEAVPASDSILRPLAPKCNP